MVMSVQLTAGREVVGVATTAAGPQGDHDSRPSRTARERTAVRAMKVIHIVYGIHIHSLTDWLENGRGTLVNNTVRVCVCV